MVEKPPIKTPTLEMVGTIALLTLMCIDLYRPTVFDYRRVYDITTPFDHGSETSFSGCVFFVTVYILIIYFDLSAVYGQL